jgi:hypothetical protein
MTMPSPGYAKRRTGKGLETKWLLQVELQTPACCGGFYIILWRLCAVVVLGLLTWPLTAYRPGTGRDSGHLKA